MMTITADPDIVVVIYEESVRIPGIHGDILCGLSPTLNDVTVRAELDYSRRWDTSCAERWILNSRCLLRRQRFREVSDPNVVLRVHKNSGHRTQNPVIGHILGPAWIDLEYWCFTTYCRIIVSAFAI